MPGHHATRRPGDRGISNRTRTSGAAWRHKCKETAATTVIQHRIKKLIVDAASLSHRRAHAHQARYCPSQAQAAECLGSWAASLRAADSDSRVFGFGFGLWFERMRMWA